MVYEHGPVNVLENGNCNVLEFYYSDWSSNRISKIRFGCSWLDEQLLQTVFAVFGNTRIEDNEKEKIEEYQVL